MKKTCLAILFAAVAACTASIAAAQEFPDKTIRLVVPFAPGNSTDTLSRILAEKMSEELGQSVVVENHGGGGGMIGAAIVAQAPADGYTVLISTNSIQTAAPLTMKDLPLDPATSFEPVSLLAEISQLILVPAESEFQTLEDLIEGAKSQELTYPAPNTISQFAAELLGLRAGLKFLMVPYSATAQSLNDISTGDIDVGFIGYTTSAPYLQAGTIRALATTSQERLPQLPDVPVAAEIVPDYYSAAWIGAFVPAGTPEDVVATLNEAFVNALNDPDVKATMDSLAIVGKPTTPAELRAYVDADIEVWTEVTRETGWEKR